MPRRNDPVELPAAAAHTLATSNRLCVYLVERMSDELWRAKVPGSPKTVGAIVAHIHNVRCMWVKALGPKLGVKTPARLDRATATRAQALAALDASQAALATILDGGLAVGRIAGFPPDAMHFLGYLIAHDAHHRGQICMLARELGHPLPKEATFGLWDWSARSKETSPRPAPARRKNA